MIAEGYPIPTKLPLTKAEEKALKRVRRKIKNKVKHEPDRLRPCPGLLQGVGASAPLMPALTFGGPWESWGCSNCHFGASPSRSQPRRAAVRRRSMWNV